ncbi:MAG: tRNA (adenosine(37)-N6)-threonylcarbamoyltransferase complex transferase subunit TsaD [Planctomycetes bacterium]|nr:tRNA (adenosine(37)-N6)-threonylcarbamoyltransferase complex transferase subunit TsaD [Planctomycetota bacterium]MCB9830724.1 tRNA (adenosine(37)-N6)-threonylcarbamoyltransferase complex transferase subunit TsaD [Planctomycetota bacterium]MCB9902321.1 tRNA (adenosine(37)-N6)-threonylcarbamoyltransferase complex transferase subunit TsaD [Planctomycetota bacterium]
MRVLGIDTSCDDTAAAVLDGPRTVLSNVVASQHDLHAAFGGVVPEIASRAHAERVSAVIATALEEAGATPASLDAIAVTNRPGLVGSLLVGVAAAKTLAWAWDLPLVGVHHIEAHVLSALADHPELEPPFVSLVASGGHTALYLAEDLGTIHCLGATVDDAAGESFDKVAVLLDLPQPGGPHVSRLAESGDPKAVRFPRSRPGADPMGFSFSGLKTAVLYHLKGPGGKRDAPDRPDLDTSPADVAASFEMAVVDVLATRTCEAVAATGVKRVAIGGGVAANRTLRRVLAERLPSDVPLYAPSPKLCVDNGAMIALRGHALLEQGLRSSLDLEVRATGDDAAG